MTLPHPRKPACRRPPPRGDDRVLTMRVLMAVARAHGVPEPEVRCLPRCSAIRAQAIWLSARRFGRGLSELGRFYGRHHATVFHARRQVDDLIRVDDALRERLGRIEAEIRRDGLAESTVRKAERHSRFCAPPQPEPPARRRIPMAQLVAVVRDLRSQQHYSIHRIAALTGLGVDFIAAATDTYYDPVRARATGQEWRP